MGATDDKIRISCAGCGVRLALPAAAAGRTVRCPKCKTPVTIPAPELPVMELDDAPLSPEHAAAPTERLEPPPRGEPLHYDVSKEPPPNFYSALNKVSLYPVSNASGIVFLVMAGSIWAFIRAFFGFGGILMMVLMIIFWIIVAGYISAFMWQILFDTATHKPETPRNPDVTEIIELILHCIRFFGASFVAFLPAITVAAVGLIFVEGIVGLVAVYVVAGLLSLFGIFYYPMALMMIGFCDSLWAPLNYGIGIRGIIKILPNYSVCALYFAGTFIGATLMESQVVTVLSGSLLTKLIAIMLTTMIDLYLFMIQMRALGFLYLCNKERLGWFR